MDYCLISPSPPRVETNGTNKIWACSVYWLWSSDEEHKLHTIKPLILPPFVLSPADTCYNHSAHQEYFSLRSDLIWGAKSGIFARKTNIDSKQQLGGELTGLAWSLSVLSTLVRGCCELNSNGWTISVLTFFSIFPDFGKTVSDDQVHTNYI